MTDSDRNPARLDDDRLWVLLDSSLAGDAGSAEVTIVREWLAADPKRSEVLEDLRRVREIASAGKKLRSTDEAWSRLLPALQLELSRPSQSGEGPAAPPLRRRDASRGNQHSAGWRIAATVVVTIGLSSVATTFVVSRRHAAPTAAASDTGRAFATSRGERVDVRLADGSRVRLGPESRLVVWPSARNRRDVHLDGEAYFEVLHNDRRPFTVHARNAIVRDVGTRFAVRAYALDTLVQVVVTEGQVSVRSDSAAGTAETLLNPRMLARVNAAGAISVQTTEETSRYLGFTKGRIVFVGKPLREVVPELERWYDIRIQLADARMGDRRITATIADQTLPDLLDQLSIALSVRVSRSGQLIVLSDKATPKHAPF